MKTLDDYMKLSYRKKIIEDKEEGAYYTILVWARALI